MPASDNGAELHNPFELCKVTTLHIPRMCL